MKQLNKYPVDPPSSTTSPDADFVAFLNSVDNAKADSVNPAFKRGDRASRYASLAGVLDTVKEAATKFNIAVRQILDTSEDGKLIISTVFQHTSGMTWSGGRLCLKTDHLTSSQQLGSVLTYARRYSLTCAAGIATEDDGGNAASTAPASIATVQPRPASPFSPRPTA